MPSVVVSPTARRNLRTLVETHELPADTTDRVRRLLAPLADFPDMGSPLHGRWQGFRYLLGPWPWMLIVYSIEETKDRVVVTTIQDGRRTTAATSSGDPS